MKSLLEEKICPQCHQAKPLTAFHKDRHTGDGYTCWCKECRCKCYRDKYADKLPHSREETKEQSARWRKNNPERQKALARQQSTKMYATARGRYSRMKQRAKLKNIDFDLEIGEFIKWFNGQQLLCHYCEANLELNSGTGYSWASLTIDRRDNNEGYTISNIVLACKRCNAIKGIWFSEHQMKEIAQKYFMGTRYGK